jgi:hypothetical protein
MNKVILIGLVVVLGAVGLAGCKRNTFDYGNIPPQEGETAPAYTFNPDLNNPGVSKPADGQ